MAVDIAFEEGKASRGFGFLLQWNDDIMMTAEVTSFQEVAIWVYDYETQMWEMLDGAWTSAVRPGFQTNRLEVEVSDAGNGRSNVFVSVNGRTVAIAYAQPAFESVVGLTLYGHAMAGRFDNFEFESYAPYGGPLEDPSSSGPMAGGGDPDEGMAAAQVKFSEPERVDLRRYPRSVASPIV
jgi:hypothetical protein